MRDQSCRRIIHPQVVQGKIVCKAAAGSLITPKCSILFLPQMFSFPRISRVAIIGAGPGGIAAARALRAEGDAFEKITLFERNASVGGTW